MREPIKMIRKSHKSINVCKNGSNQNVDTPDLSKKRPEGSSLGSKANFTALAAPSSTVRMPVFKFISVLT